MLAILWNDPAKQESATKAMRITADDLHSLGLVDDVIEEPIIGAHRDKEAAAKALGDYFLESIDELDEFSDEDRLSQRYEKICSIGAFSE